VDQVYRHGLRNLGSRGGVFEDVSTAVHLAERACSREANRVHVEMSRGLWVLRGSTVAIPLLAFFQTLLWMLGCFRGTAGPSDQYFTALIGELAVALRPSIVGIALGVMTMWFHH